MKLGKCLNVVLALVMASAIMWGQGAEAQQAPILESVEIVSPDSGAIRGIDSTFTVKVTVIDATPAPDMRVYMWLVANGKANNPLVDISEYGGDIGDDDVLAMVFGGDDDDDDADDDQGNGVDDGDGDDIGDVELDGAIFDKLSDDGDATCCEEADDADDFDGPDNDGVPEHVDATSIVAAVQILDTDFEGSSAGPFGDASAVAVKSIEINDRPEKFEFTFTGKIPASAGTVAGVRAAAFAINEDGGSSQIKLSPIGVGDPSFIVDADRPTQGSLGFVEDVDDGEWDGPVDFTGGNALGSTELEDGGVFVNFASGANDYSAPNANPDDEAPDALVNPDKVENFDDPDTPAVPEDGIDDRWVLGVGDTLVADINTANNDNNGLITNLLSFPELFPADIRLGLKIQLQGVFNDVDLDERVGEVFRHQWVIEEGLGFGDLDPETQPSVDALAEFDNFYMDVDGCFSDGVEDGESVAKELMCADENANLILRGFTVDRAGNLSSPHYSGTEAEDDQTNNDTDEDVVNFLLDDEIPLGFTIAVEFLVDDKPPALDAQVADGDTILPTANDTISDGTVSPDVTDVDNDDTEDDDGFHLTAARKDELLTWKLAEALTDLRINFSQDGAEVAHVNITNDDLDLNNDELKADATRYLDFTGVADVANAADGDDDLISDTDATVTEGSGSDGFDVDGQRDVTSNEDFDFTFAADAGTVPTGMYTLSFVGTDVAGNVGPTLTRDNIYVDTAPIAFNRLFPTNDGLGRQIDDGGEDTVNEETAVVIFRLSEEADSISIIYTPQPIVEDEIEEVNFRLAGSLLTSLDEQEIDGHVDSLVHNNIYKLLVVGRDLAGNFTRTGGNAGDPLEPSTLRYDTTYVVPLIDHFFLSLTGEGDGKIDVIDHADTDHDPGQLGLAAADHLLAGQKATMLIQAVAADDRDAVTYEGDVTLTVNGGNGVTVTGDGVTDNGDGTWDLDLDEWLVGRYDVTVMDTAAIDTLTIEVLDEAGPYAGELDSAIVFDPEIYSQIIVEAPDTVTYGSEFWVDVTLADKFGNTRSLDTRWVEVQSDGLGTHFPENSIAIADGWGGFTAASHDDAWTSLTVRDILRTRPTAAEAAAGVGDEVVSNIDTDGDLGAEVESGNGGSTFGHSSAYPTNTADIGDDFIWASTGNIYVSSDIGIDAPDTLIAADYRGADGAGDQGGFVKLVFDLSADHGDLDGYRIWRQVSSDHGVDDNGAIVALDGPADSMVPWAFADAVPGVSMMTVIVATLDNVATHWAVSAEWSGFTTAKQAFEVGEVAENPYELMSQTMIESRKVAQADIDAPVFATLTPEALAFVEQGVAPRFKGVGNVQQSIQVRTAEAVRGIDNIAPVAVEFMRATDTPGDAGGSITLTWTKSESDALMPRMASSAVGPALSDMIPGVLGYQILRSVGDEEFALVGKAGAGETSFVDDTVFNGERYTYSVRPYDQDNVTDSDLSRTTMAIRNSVFDASGVQVLGLFGADNRVGFDDFFVFADHFGLTAGDEAFEPAFDLRPNNRVDFDDFFVFADNFGRAIEAAGKLLPSRSGLNSDARFFLSTMGDLANAGEETEILVNLADFAELKGYGFTLEYDANDLEFVKVTPVDNNLLGETALAQPRVITQKDGEVSIAAYGETAVDGELAVNLVFRFKEGTEESFVEFTQAQLRDDGFAVNQVASLDRFRIETRPESFALLNNFPNPFNPETTIKYQLPESADVKLEIRNVVGQLVRTLVVAEHQSAGRYTVQWDASNDNGQQLSSGVYFYLVEAGEFRQVKRMLLLK